MTLPARIRIGPFDYRVTTDRADVERQDRESERGHTGIGYCANDESTIIIDDHYARNDALRVVLLHEILHACIYVSGRLTGCKMSDEDFIRSVTPTLVDTLRRNPELVAYLTRASEEKP